MTKRILMYVLTLLCISVSAQNRQLFDGGMMVHAGYLSGDIGALDYRPAGTTYGIGGVLRFHLGSHVRIGGEGFVSTMALLGNDSYERLGWGGAVADFCWRRGRWMPYAGISVGGGSAATLLVFDGNNSDASLEAAFFPTVSKKAGLPERNAMFHSGTFFFLNPCLGMEYALNEAVHLTLRVDRLTPLGGEAVPTGVRCYLGFIFAH